MNQNPSDMESSLRNTAFWNGSSNLILKMFLQVLPHFTKGKKKSHLLSVTTQIRTHTHTHTENLLIGNRNTDANFRQAGLGS